MFCTSINYLNRFSLDNLKSTRLVIKTILERLNCSRIKINKQDFLVNPLGDDPLKREMEMFKLLKETFGVTLRGNRVGNAIDTFVNKGVTLKEGKLSYTQKDLDLLNEKLSRYLGPEIAAKTSSETLKMIEDQYKVSKDLVSTAAGKVGRDINKTFSKIDRKTIDIVHKDNNFFISGTYDKVLIGRVNEAVETHVESGMPKSQLAESIKETMEEELPPRADSYYQVLANDTLGRARVFGQVNSYKEARIRKYEIIAVMDERTSEICEYMDGKIFEVELASKIVKDIQNFGVPENEGQVDEIKALRPWVFFDSDAAQAGKNSLYYNDDKGNPLFLPNSGFKVGADGEFNLSDKVGISGVEIQGLSTENTNAPCLPPFHAHCRSTTAISEEDIKTQDWVENIDTNDLGFGSELTNIMNGEPSVITGIKPGEIPIVTVKGPEGETEAPIGPITTQFTPIKISKPAEGKSIKDFVKPKVITETDTPNKDRVSKVTYFEGPAKLKDKYLNILNNVYKKIPDDLFSPIEKITVYNKSKKFRRGYLLGLHSCHVGDRLSNISYWNKIPKAYRTAETGEFIPLNRFENAISHEVGHGFWKNITNIEIPGETKSKWNIYHRVIMKVIDVQPDIKIVSYYSRTDSEEHFCEAFANWINNKGLFKELEPDAYNFFENNIKPLFKGKK